MAKVIRATPTLVDEEALSFLEKMKRKENKALSSVDRKLIAIIRNHS